MSITESVVAAARRSCEARIQKLKLELVRLEGELSAYDSLLEDDRGSSTTESPELASKKSPEERKKARRRRTPKPAGTWEAIMEFIGVGTRTVDEIVQFSASRGVELSRGNVRSQMTNYRGAKYGYIANDTKPGTYALTEAGIRKFVPSARSKPGRPTINGSEVHGVAH